MKTMLYAEIEIQSSLLAGPKAVQRELCISISAAVSYLNSKNTNAKQQKSFKLVGSRTENQKIPLHGFGACQEGFFDSPSGCCNLVLH